MGACRLIAETGRRKGSAPSLAWHRNFLRRSGKLGPNSGELRFLGPYTCNYRAHNLATSSGRPPLLAAKSIGAHFTTESAVLFLPVPASERRPVIANGRSGNAPNQPLR